MESNLIKHQNKKEYRLNKYISDSGYCSRREADRLVEKGIVTINGKKAVIGMKVFEGDVVKISGVEINRKQKHTYIMLNKPRGIICTNDLKIKGNIRKFVNHKELIFPIGRLDKDSTGLILLTSDGDIVNKILREEYGHEKEYIVTTEKPFDDIFIKDMSKGVTIYNMVAHRYEKTKHATVKRLGSNKFMIILKQGLNRQIRRMVKELGNRVKDLERVRIMHIKLGDLKVGRWRDLTKDELIKLNNSIKNAK